MILICSDCNRKVGEILKGRIATNKVVIRCLSCDNKYEKFIHNDDECIENDDNGALPPIFQDLFRGMK